MIQKVAERLRSFLFDEKATAQAIDIWLKLRICGYTVGRPSPEI
jgi:hypothetical protein